MSALHVVLYQPAIPQNTGNIGRMCAIANVRLHLIHPLGFIIDDRHLRRSGMDYWHHLDVCEHASWQAFMASPLRPRRLWLLSTHARRSFWSARYQAEDGLVFGNETSGAPPWLHQAVGPEGRLRIDHFAPHMRSLNLATSVGIATYEACRQLHGAAGPGATAET